MAGLREESKWEDLIYQIENTDPVSGGEDGIANLPTRQLANRTLHLKDELKKLDIDVTARIKASINELVDGAPGTLDTLNDIAKALANNTEAGAELANALTRVAALEAGKSDNDHLHDDRYYTQDDINEHRTAEAARVNADIAAARARLDGVDAALARGYVAKHEAGGLAAGWYTIAITAASTSNHWPSRAMARFGVWDIASNLHQAVVFYAAHHFGTDASNTLTLLANSYHSRLPIKKLRIKDNGTYEGAALQVYVDGGKYPVYVSAAILGDNVQEAGWVLADFLPDATPPPDVDNWADFTPKSQIDLAQSAQGGMATTGDIYAGGDMVQHQVLHTGTRGLIAPHHLAKDAAHRVLATDSVGAPIWQDNAGVAPAHQWSATSLRLKNPDGTWGGYANLKGDKGATGAKGDKGDTAVPSGTITNFRLGTITALSEDYNAFKEKAGYVVVGSKRGGSSRDGYNITWKARPAQFYADGQWKTASAQGYSSNSTGR